MTENGKKILEQISKDEALKKALEGVQTVEEALKVLSAHGMDATEEDFAMSEDDALSLEEMEAVAGGMCVCVAAGGGTGDGAQCGCVLVGFNLKDPPPGHAPWLQEDSCDCIIIGRG